MLRLRAPRNAAIRPHRQLLRVSSTDISFIIHCCFTCFRSLNDAAFTFSSCQAVVMRYKFRAAGKNAAVEMLIIDMEQMAYGG